MAVIKLGAIISDIRGKLQNGIYSLATGGVHYVKNIPASVTNPNSEDQQLVRQTLQFAAKTWYGTLTDAQRTGWEEMAQILAGLSSEGNGGILNLVPPIGMKGSGLNAFVAFYTRSVAAGLTPTLDAPIGEQQPLPPTGVSAAYLNPDLTFTFTQPVIHEVGAWVAVWIATHEKIYHKQIIGYHDATFPMPYVLQSARGAKGKYLAFNKVAPCNMIVQMQTINPSGWASEGSQTIEVAIV